MGALVFVMMLISVFLGLYTFGEAIVDKVKTWWRRDENITYCRLWKERMERTDLPNYNGRIY